MAESQTCTIVERETMFTLTITRETTPPELGAVFAECFPTVFTFITSKGIEPSGRPFGRYIEMTETKVVVECGIPVPRELEGEGEITSSQITPGRYVELIHMGSFDTLGDSHAAMNAYIAANNLQIIGPPIEFYVTDPETETDPANWRTDIIYPIA